MKVFISHAHQDETLARKVAAVLEADGLEVWDGSEIVPGENWAEKISQALKESEAMVVLLTPDALRSNWVRREIEYALSNKAYSKRLIPVLVGLPEQIPAEDIPWILRHMKMINLPQRGMKEEEIQQIAEALKEVA